MLDISLDLLFHPIPHIVFPKSIIHGFDTLMSGNRGIMKVCDKRLALFVRAICGIDQLNSYWIQEYLVLIIIAQRYIMVQSPTKRICKVHLASFLIDKLV